VKTSLIVDSFVPKIEAELSLRKLNGLIIQFSVIFPIFSEEIYKAEQLNNLLLVAFFY
jgi:hypothetical protein